MPNATVISIAIQKGGSGKTTTCYNVGGAKAKNGSMVLMIDADPQYSLTLNCGIMPDDESLNNISTCSLFENDVNPLSLCLNVNASKLDNLFLIPSSQNLALTLTKLKKSSKGILNFKKNITKLRNYFDYIFIDCPPSLDELLLSALISSDKTLIPVKPDLLSYNGLPLIMSTINAVQQDTGELGNPKLKSSILVNMFRKQRLEHKTYLKAIEDNYGNIIGIIPDAAIVTKELIYNRPCTLAHPTSQAAKDYFTVCSKI